MRPYITCDLRYIQIQSALSDKQFYDYISQIKQSLNKQKDQLKEIRQIIKQEQDKNDYDQSMEVEFMKIISYELNWLQGMCNCIEIKILKIFDEIDEICKEREENQFQSLDLNYTLDELDIWTQETNSQVENQQELQSDKEADQQQNYNEQENILEQKLIGPDFQEYMQALNAYKTVQEISAMQRAASIELQQQEETILRADALADIAQQNQDKSNKLLKRSEKRLNEASKFTVLILLFSIFTVSYLDKFR